jgi:hypothetical protein
VTAPGGVGPEDQWRVIDGDTIDYRAADGEHVRFRLMGINAPEDPNINQDALDAKKNLAKLLADAETVTIGQFNVDRYGTTQRFYTIDPSGDGLKENERVFGWLYIDGIVVYSPDAFSSDNPRGVGIGGTVPPYQQMWIDNGGEPKEGVT